MAKWEKRSIKLKGDHGWKARPGYHVFVADRGAVRFEFPQDWVIVPGESGSIKFHDRQPPDDDCTLQISIMRLPPQVDWSGLSLAMLIEQVVEQDTRNIFEKGEVVEIRRPDLEIAWLEIRFIDPNECRAAHSRTCLARAGTIQPLITFDYWADDAERLEPVWDVVMDSMVLGQYIDDPRKGPPR